MLTSSILTGLRVLRTEGRRNIGVWAPAMSKAEPVQQLFLDSLRSYTDKCKSSGKQLVDASPEIEKELVQERERVRKSFGGSAGADFTKFPEFKFADVVIDPIHEQAPAAK